MYKNIKNTKTENGILYVYFVAKELFFGKVMMPGF